MKIVLLGAGGHGRVVMTSLIALGQRPLGAVDADTAKHGSRLTDGTDAMPIPVLGGDDSVPPDAFLANGIGCRPSRGDAGLGVRRRVFERFGASRFLTVKDPSATVRGSVALGFGVQILAGAAVQTGAKIGDNAVVNTGALVDHDCEVGRHAFVAPGAVLCGGVIVGPEAFIGARATVLPGISVGSGAVVAAGAVVRRDVEPGGFAS